MLTADVNRDGKPDLALAASGLAVRRGNCSPPAPCPLDSVFESGEDFIAGRNPAALIVADLNGDGVVDGVDLGLLLGKPLGIRKEHIMLSFISVPPRSLHPALSRRAPASRPSFTQDA